MIVVIDKLYNKMFYRLSLVMSGIWTHPLIHYRTIRLAFRQAP
jgi:hypothetical protein